jgi:hypothetical protein
MAVFGLAWVISRGGAPRAESSPDLPVRTKSSNRSARSSPTGDDSRLLAEFMRAVDGKKSPYQELKESLPVASDLKGAVEAAIKELLANGSPGAGSDQSWMLAVRALHWLRRDPEQAMDFLTSGADSDNRKMEILYFLGSDVFPDVVVESGLLNSLHWMSKSPVSMNTVPYAALTEIKSGGGLSFFMKLEEALGDSMPPGARNRSGAWRDFDRSVGRLLPFEEKDRLLAYVKEQTDAAKQHELLLGFAQSGEPAMDWILDLINRGDLDAELAAKLKGGLGNEVLNKPGMEMAARVEARRATKGNENKDRQSIINEIVGGDVKQLLINGRDWRYEFRTGVSSLEDVLTAVREGLPQVPPEGESALLVSLYRQLSEENPTKALPLLDSLPEEKRREVLFSNTWEAYGGNNPDDYVRFLNSLPEPVTEKEKAERIKGWDWKARPNLARYGDDYVDWVIQLPPGLDRDRAMNSLVWATREQDPAKARELEARLYPKKP